MADSCSYSRLHAMPSSPVSSPTVNHPFFVACVGTYTGFISQLFQEIAPTLLPVPGVDTKTYQKKLVERFGE